MEPAAALRKRLQRVCHETLAWLILFSLALLREFIFEEASSLSAGEMVVSNFNDRTCFQSGICSLPGARRSVSSYKRTPPLSESAIAPIRCGELGTVQFPYATLISTQVVLQTKVTPRSSVKPGHETAEFLDLRRSISHAIQMQLS